VHVTAPGIERFELKSAILLYTNGGSYYATLHGIETKGQPVIGPGAPVTAEAIAPMVRSLGLQSGFDGFLSPELLYVGPDAAAWWRPPAPARVFFQTREDDDGKGIGTATAVTPHPGLVFVLARSWYVFAVRGNERPGPNTPLYRAPYFNVWESGEICEGNLERPSAVTPESLAAFERGFFESRFTHPNVRNGKLLTSYPGGVTKLWKDLLAGKHKNFPEHRLVKTKATLAERLKKLQSGGRDD
ncbi:MAG TPA: PRTRC system protein B, partial [Burkholderiales bacterium]|nr:PRTRC system protein B [Burkholderiales bacterium]